MGQEMNRSTFDHGMLVWNEKGDLRSIHDASAIGIELNKLISVVYSVDDIRCSKSYPYLVQLREGEKFVFKRVSSEETAAIKALNQEFSVCYR